MHGLILTGFIDTNGVAIYARTGGAHRIATFLREKGWDIEVLDFLMGWDLEQLKEFARSRVNSKTVFLGFGGTFPIWSNTLEEFFKWFKQEYKHIALIAGGQVVHSYKINADWYVDGFGELGLEALLKHITNTGSEKLKFKIGKFGKKIIKSNLDYPAYPMQSLKIKYEDRDFIIPEETLVTELGRGCIFNCDFCNFPVLGVKEDHTRSAEDFYEEMQDTYNRFGVTKYQLADETVNDYTEKLEKFADVVKRLSFQPRLFGFARADLFVSRKQDWDIMLGMGFVGHHYGIESFNYESVKAMGKGMHPDKMMPKLLEAKSYFKKHGFYRGQISIIAGLPYETPETFDKGLTWLREHWKHEGTIAFPLYIPKSDGEDTVSLLSSKWKNYGYEELPSEDIKNYRENYSNTTSMAYGLGESLENFDGINWKNKHWDLKEVSKIINKFWSNAYYPHHNGPPMWNVGLWEMILKKTPEEIVDKRIIDLAPNQGIIRLRSMGYINQYITKKLNWTKNV